MGKLWYFDIMKYYWAIENNELLIHAITWMNLKMTRQPTLKWLRKNPYMCMSVCMFSPFIGVWLFANLWTVAHQAPLSMGFSREEYWSRLPCPPPGDRPDPGIEPISCVSCNAGRFFTDEPQGSHTCVYLYVYLIIIICIYTYRENGGINVNVNC